MKDRNTMLERIIHAILAEYLSIYYVDLETNRYEVFSNTLSLEPSSEADFFKSCRLDAEKYVYEEDRKKIVDRLTRDGILEYISLTNIDLLEYRLTLDGELNWCCIRLIQGEYSEHGKYAVLGVKDINNLKLVDDELANLERERNRYNQIAEALANLFDSLYYVDLSDNGFIEFSSTDRYKRIRTMARGDNFFTAAKALLNRFIHPEDTDKIICLYDKAEMLASLRRGKGAFNTEYRFVINSQLYYCRAGIRITKDKTHALVSIANVDDEYVTEQKLQEYKRMNVTYSQISEILAEHYDTIYYVNIRNNNYVLFSSSDVLSDLEKAERKNDFFDNTIADIDKIIYADDRETVKAFFQKDELIRELLDFKAKQLEYRLLIDGAPVYVKLTAMLAKDRTHMLICVENINEQVIHYKNLDRKANYDELTGAKNKNAYKDFAADLDRRIGEPAELDFAVLVCDINNLKKINDTLGHMDGDKYIKNASQLICNTFVHSPVFRVGGDEFVVVLQGRDYKNRDNLVRRFQSVVSYNATYEVTPARPVVASGMCEYVPGKHTKTAEVFSEADRLMYENKQRLKRI